jgi:murein DD-endopeptidase MepM/ murein hydrolase activator NlpD
MNRAGLAVSPAGTLRYASPMSCAVPAMLPLTAIIALCAWSAVADAASAYRYKDASGQWVYTDRPPQAGGVQPVAVSGGGAATPRIVVEPRSTPSGLALVAVNECRCVVEFGVKTAASSGERAAKGSVEPQSERVLLEIPAAAVGDVAFEYGYVIGAPGAIHAPTVPYRAPFALARSFKVTQAAPDAITHVDAASRHAVDIAMPVGTAVHAARAGLVINVAHRHFRGGLQASNADEANFVQVLHDDGTHAIYAHLQLNTVRVRPGQSVARGEYIANSGNTGFSSGPHLHFVVLRNAGLRSEAVPVVFAGPAGASVAARSGQPLTAY